MAETHAAFVGSIPEKYDRYLGSVFFRDFAEQTAARLEPRQGMRVLEAACGTGIVTARLLARLGGQGRLVATDLNDAMLEYAKLHVPRREVGAQLDDDVAAGGKRKGEPVGHLILRVKGSNGGDLGARGCLRQSGRPHRRAPRSAS